MLATPATSLLVGVVLLAFLIKRGFHRDLAGSLSRRKMASVFLLSASTYTFVVLVLSQLVFRGPAISILVDKGFGNERVAWLMVGVSLDGAFRIWEEFRTVPQDRDVPVE